MKATYKTENNTKEEAQPKKQSFNSETNESSKKDMNLNNQNNLPKEKIYKKSIDLFPKKLSIEGLNDHEIRERRYTLENNLRKKDFVPQIRPIKMYMIPSKLRLNKKGFKDLKRNQNNVLLNAKKYFISCPNLEDEESDKEISELPKKYSESISSEIFSGDKKDNLNLTRKVLQNIKKRNIPKISSKNNPIFKNKYNEELNLGYSSGDELYDMDELNNYSLGINNQENIIKNINKEEKEKIKGRDRFNSWSILDILQKNYKLDDE